MSVTARAARWTSTAKSAAVIEQFAKVGGVASPTTPQDYARFLETEQAKWGKVVTAIGFKEQN